MPKACVYSPATNTIISADPRDNLGHPNPGFKFWRFGAQGASQPDFTLQQTIIHPAAANVTACDIFGDTIVWGYNDGSLKLFDLKTNTITHELPRQHGHNAILECHFSADGQQFISIAEGDRNLRIWSRSGISIGTIEHGYPLTSCAFYRDQNKSFIVYADNLGHIYWWNSETRTTIQGMGNADAIIRQICSSSKQEIIAVLQSTDPTESDRIQLWKYREAELVWHPMNQINSSLGRKINCATFSANGRRLIAGCSDGYLMICDPDTGQTRELIDPSYHTAITSCFFSSEGNILFSESCDDKQLKAWELPLSLAVSASPMTGAAAVASTHPMQLRPKRAGTALSSPSKRGGYSPLSNVGNGPSSPRTPTHRPIAFSLETLGTLPSAAATGITPAMRETTFGGPHSPHPAAPGSPSPFSPYRSRPASPGAAGPQIPAASLPLRLERMLSIEGQYGGPITCCTITRYKDETEAEHYYITAGGADGRLITWKVDTTVEPPYQLYKERTGHGNSPINCCAFSPDEQLFISGANQPLILLRKANRTMGDRLFLRDSTKQFQLAPLEQVRSCSFSTDNKEFIIGTKNPDPRQNISYLKIFNTENPVPVFETIAMENAVKSCYILPNTDMLYSTGNMIYLYKRGLAERGIGLPDVINFCTYYYTQDKLLIAAALNDGRVAIIELTPPDDLSSKKIKYFDIKPGASVKMAALCCVFSRDRNFIIIGRSDGYIITHSLNSVDGAAASESLYHVFSMKAHKRAVTSLAISADGQYLVSGSDDATVKLWQLVP